MDLTLVLFIFFPQFSMSLMSIPHDDGDTTSNSHHSKPIYFSTTALHSRVPFRDLQSVVPLTRIARSPFQSAPSPPIHTNPRFPPMGLILIVLSLLTSHHLDSPALFCPSSLFYIFCRPLQPSCKPLIAVPTSPPLHAPQHRCLRHRQIHCGQYLL
ncbi:hypothetical protein BGW80DRAFT_540449 [Lactifluus volemus]|nr:hypothetical protein BGW80DRAFT_540449 [Lactifluus volemus]